MSLLPHFEVLRLPFLVFTVRFGIFFNNFFSNFLFWYFYNFFEFFFSVPIVAQGQVSPGGGTSASAPEFAGNSQLRKTFFEEKLKKNQKWIFGHRKKLTQ